MNKHECNQMSKATELFREDESLSKKDIKGSGYSIVEDSEYGWSMNVPHFNGDWVCVEHQIVKNIKCCPFCMKHLIDSRSILDKEFISIVKSNEDFIKAYIVSEDISTIWLVIKESVFVTNKKYLKAEREFRKKTGHIFKVVIFSEVELDEIHEQLKDYDSYKEVI